MCTDVMLFASQCPTYAHIEKNNNVIDFISYLLTVFFTYNLETNL